MVRRIPPSLNHLSPLFIVPNAAEPYLTIARIYEDQNDHEKAFEVR